MKRPIALVTATAALVLLTAGIAAGHKTAAPATVQDLKAEKPADPAASVQVSGRVESVARCRGNRSVIAFQDVDPRGPSPLDVALAQDLTDTSGLFLIVPAATLQPDKVYVIVKKRVTRRPGHRHKCKRTVSSTVTVKKAK